MQKRYPPSERSRQILKSFMDQAKDNLSVAIKTHGMTLEVLNSAFANFSQSLLPLPDEAACKKSCAYCCHLRVGCSIAEAIIIFNHLKATTTTEGFEHFKHKIQQTGSPQEIILDAWWLKYQTPCPFLDHQKDQTGQKKNHCLIYDIRPFSCRAYHSTDVSACQDGFKAKKTTQIPCFPLYRAFTDIYSSVFVTVLEQHGLFSFQVGFVRALQILFENEDSNENATDHWFRGEDVFNTARLS